MTLTPAAPMLEPELYPGLLVDYADNDGQTSPACIAEILDPDRKIVRLAVPPHIADGCVRNVPFAPELDLNTWTYQTKVRGRDIRMVNPYGSILQSRHWFSASQMKAWNICRRQWAFKHVEKIKGTNKYAMRGNSLHGFMHGWLGYGISPPDDVREGRLARAAIFQKVGRGKKQRVEATNWLPLPGEARIEQRVNYVSRGGYIYNLAIDFEFNSIWEGRPIQIVGDHKTTTDFKWALSKEELAFDIQGLIYAAYVLSDQSLSEVLLRWLYYEDDKARPRGKAVEVRLTRSEVEERFQKIDALAAEMVREGLTKKAAADLPANAHECNARGGCPYRDRCPITNQERLLAYMTQSSLRERLQAGTNGAHKADTVAKAAETPAAKAGDAVEAPNALERLRAAAGAKKAAEEKPASAQTRDPGGQASPQAPLPAAKAPATAAGGSLADRLRKKAEESAAQAAAAAPETPAAATTTPAAATTAEPKGLLARMAEAKAASAGPSTMDRLKQAAAESKKQIDAAAPLRKAKEELEEAQRAFKLAEGEAFAAIELGTDNAEELGEKAIAAEERLLKAAAAVEVEEAKLAAQPAASAPATVTDPPETFESSSEHEPSDVNPPEAPENPIQDADELAEANASAAPPKGKAGRPKGAATVKPVSDEGYIFGRALGELLKVSPNIGVAVEMAGESVRAYRKLMKELGKGE